MSKNIGFCLLYIAVTICNGFDWKGLNLPDEHIPYYFTNNPDIKSECQHDPECPYKVRISNNHVLSLVGV